MALFRPVATTDDLPHPGTGSETGTYEFKGSVDLAKRRELAKDVAAFANATGGVILVGAEQDEVTGTLRKYAPVSEAVAESIADAYDRAVADHCRPLPFAGAVKVRAPPPLDGFVVAVNVNGIPLGPVGVSWVKDPKCPNWAFPLRTTRHTTYITPTELAMFMVPEIRRVAILLDSIPLDQRKGVLLVANSRAGDADPRTVTFLGLDQLFTTLNLRAEQSGEKIAIPLDRVASVWRRDLQRWGIVLRGRFEIAQGTLTVLSER